MSPQYFLYTTGEYDDWFARESPKAKLQIEKRLSHLKNEGHFGDHKRLDDLIWELRWKNGRRLYYALIPENNVLLLLGGNKNGQDKDIAQAKKIYTCHLITKN